jgi:drug/metabolite transporter (DMT)-like permease
MMAAAPRDNLRGALWMAASAVAFAAMAALVKLLADNQSVAVMIFWRSLAGLIATLPFAFAIGREAWAVRRPGKLILRSTYGTAGFFLGFYALAELPLADAQALSFSRTLFITILAVWILKEKVAWRRWTAVAVGFVGILMMTKPGAALDPAALAAIGSALAFALAIVTVKDLTADHSPTALVLYANLLTTLAGVPFILLDPSIPSLPDAALLFAMGVAGVIAQGCYVKGMASGDASLMGIVDYLRLPLAGLLGYWLFAEVPDGWALAGAAIVIVSTVYITFRESQVRVARPPEPPG